ncbi:MAG: 4Fe-4S binding protein, partial [Sarcina sp.]
MKKSKISYLRIISQIFFFIFYPGLFALSFSQIGNVVSMIVNKNFSGEMFVVNILLSVILIALSIVFGRFFCGWMCSFGAMNDLLYFISRKIFKINIKVDENVDKVLKLLKYVVLLFIIIVFWILGMSFSKEMNPWIVFSDLVKWPITIPAISLALAFFIMIVIGSFLIERFFCKYLCPLGAIFAITSKFRFTTINKDRNNCGKCTACTAKCSMGLSLYKEDKVGEGDCISCYKCAEVCPKKNVEIKFLSFKLNPVILTAIFLIFFFILYFIKSAITNKILKNYNVPLVGNKSEGTDATTKVVKAPTKNLYENGTYTGIGTGYSSQVKVKVTIEDNKITNVNVSQIGDTPSYYKVAVKILEKEIVQAQSANVDVVAGASQSSLGIIQGAKNALIKAIGGKGNSETITSDNNIQANYSSASNGSENVTSFFPSSTATATVGNSTAKVSVELDGQMIENVKVLSLSSPEKNANEAKTQIPNEIVDSQSTNVSLVQGATDSSKAIIDGVEKAIK